jgi:hypothetical protein
VAVINHATSAAEITDQSHSKDGSPTASPATAISVMAVIRIIHLFFTFITFLPFDYFFGAKVSQKVRILTNLLAFCLLNAL